MKNEYRGLDLLLPAAALEVGTIGNHAMRAVKKMDLKLLAKMALETAPPASETRQQRRRREFKERKRDANRP